MSQCASASSNPTKMRAHASHCWKSFVTPVVVTCHPPHGQLARLTTDKQHLGGVDRVVWRLRLVTAKLILSRTNDADRNTPSQVLVGYFEGAMRSLPALFLLV